MARWQCKFLEVKEGMIVRVDEQAIPVRDQILWTDAIRLTGPMGWILAAGNLPAISPDTEFTMVLIRKLPDLSALS